MISVVLIDDHNVMRQGTRLILHQTDDIRVVAETDDADTGVELVRRHAPDVCILDMRLRDTSGVEVAREIRKIAPATRILVLTAYDYEQYVKAMINVGVNGYLLKDASASELISAVRVVVSGGTVLNPGVASKVIDMFTARKTDLPDLSERERQVLELLAQTMTNSDIAESLGIGSRTAEAHVGSLISKFRVSSRAEVVAMAAKMGLIQIIE